MRGYSIITRCILTSSLSGDIYCIQVAKQRGDKQGKHVKGMEQSIRLKLVRNFVLIYRLRMDEWQSRFRRKMNSQRKETQNTAKHFNWRENPSANSQPFSQIILLQLLLYFDIFSTPI